MAFGYCSSLQSFTFSSNVSSLDAGIFRGCNNLTILEVESSNPKFKSVDGVIYDINEETLVLYPPGLGYAVIGRKIKQFEANAFAYSERLQYIAFHSGNEMETFNEYTFYECSSLKTVQFPVSLKTISSNCFSNCKSLKSITLPSSLTRIDDNAFIGCNSLKEIRYCGSNKVEGTQKAFEVTNIVVYVTQFYEYQTFCSILVSKELTPDCYLETKPKTCVKHIYNNICLGFSSYAIQIFVMNK